MQKKNDVDIECGLLIYDLFIFETIQYDGGDGGGGGVDITLLLLSISFFEHQIIN